MTSFAYFYYLNRTADANQFTVAFRTPSDASSYYLRKTGDPEATEFNVGDSISIYHHDDPDLVIPFNYLGTFDQGIVLQEISTGSHFTFTDQVYSFNDPITVEEIPYPVCFVQGTLINTSKGPVTIENLVAGDIVQGSSGWRTVKWVGWRKYGANAFKTDESISRIAPVRIRAHAIADNVPSSDLLTSPWHHLFVEGKLVRAGDLVNGITITQETHVTEVSYYHVELDQFDVIMAHGMYSESWTDGGNRNFFQNVDVTSLRPEDMQRRRASRPGFDHLVLRQGKPLEAIRRNIAARASVISEAKEKIQKVA